MKSNLQKIIASISVLCICFSLLGISVYAYNSEFDYIYTTEKDAFLDTVNLINAYSSGEISYDDFVSDLTYVQGKAVTANLDVAAVKIKQFIDVLNFKFDVDSSHGGITHGGGSVGGSRSPITDIWNDICNKNDVPTETTQTPVSNTNGYGALAVVTSGIKKEYFYSDYIIVPYDDKDPCVFYQKSTGNYCHYVSYSNGNKIYDYDTASPEAPPKSIFGGLGNYTVEFYGDVRYKDGTQAPTDDTYEYGSIYNYEGLTDKELKDLIDELADKIQVEYPDLSNVEGLLNAIYGRLSQLDSDDDGAMLSAINAAIVSLASDNKASSSELIELLKELKEKKAEGADLAPILKELKEINNSLDYLKAVNTLDLIGDTIESLLELTETEKTYLDTYSTLILNLITKLGYAPVTAMINNLEALVLNGTPPKDIVISVYGKKLVLLSVSSLESMNITSTLNLAKLFVSVLLAISWLYSMRKKITGGA